MACGGMSNAGYRMITVTAIIILSVTANKEKKELQDTEENPLDVLHEAIG